MNRWQPLVQLLMSRFREFSREPEVIFWVYGFPVLLAVGLGVAFWNTQPKPPAVDVQKVPALVTETNAILEQLQSDNLDVELHDADDCRQRQRIGKTALFVIPTATGFEYVYDPTRAESVAARCRVDAALARWKAAVEVKKKDDGVTREYKAGASTWQTTEAITKEPGNRYIDFLLPGLMGMNIMGGGMWGVGFVIVDMRVRKLLKRLLATPMRRDHLMLAILAARMVIMLPEMIVLLLAGYFIFTVPIRGSLWIVALLIVVGASAFSGIGLLLASRTDKTETISGLINLVMLPMWLLSGTFFSAKRFPDVVQPIIQALPLTQLNNALREVMLEGATLLEVAPRAGYLAAWALVCFLLALRWFRWQ